MTRKGSLIMGSRIGLIGCGNISDIYLRTRRSSATSDFVACADLKPEAAKRQAERYGLAQRTVDELLASDDVDIVLNLTIPDAHAEVSRGGDRGRQACLQRKAPGDAARRTASG